MVEKNRGKKDILRFHGRARRTSKKSHCASNPRETCILRGTKSPKKAGKESALTGKIEKERK